MQGSFFDTAWKLNMDRENPTVNRAEFEAEYQRGQQAKREREARENESRERSERARREQQERERRQYRERRHQAHNGEFFDPYAVLGVSRSASSAEIRAAWAAACKANHPDLHGGSDEAIKRVNRAYEMLKKGR